MMKIAAIAALVAVASAAEINNVDVQPSFEEWSATFGKSFEDADFTSRKAIFEDNVAFMDAHNARYAAGKSTYTLGVNEFSAMTHDEFKAMYLGPKIPVREQKNVELITRIAGTSAADSVDWRTKGAVTPVKNQGSCGSCWSFSTTGSTEGRVQIATGKLTSLSEQQLMDCSTAEGDHSCNGGLMDYAFEYIIKNGGLDSEADYPYKMRDEACDKSKEGNKVVTISSYKDVTKSNAAQMAAAVEAGPVSVAIEADQRAFQSYKSGVFSADCGTQLDHGVLVVGYTADAWIVKNSWGATWGQEGYIELSKTTGGSDGECGVLLQPSYPIAGKGPAPGPAPPGPPGPNPPPPPPPPGPAPSGHYGDPNAGPCEADEQAVQINGVGGSFCSPACEGLFKRCPTDIPDHASAEARCILEAQGKTSPSNCALVCQPSANAADGSNAQCPDKATCKSISGEGLCTYDS